MNNRISEPYSTRARHLRGGDDGLAGLVALLDHHLLRQEDLLGGDLHAQVAASDHDGVALLQDLVEVLDALLVLHLADDPDLAAFGAQDLRRRCMGRGDRQTQTDEVAQPAKQTTRPTDRPTNRQTDEPGIAPSEAGRNMDRQTDRQNMPPGRAQRQTQNQGAGGA
jgi:hypothetical protein